MDLVIISVQEEQEQEQKEQDDNPTLHTWDPICFHEKEEPKEAPDREANLWTQTGTFVQTRKSKSNPKENVLKKHRTSCPLTLVPH